MVWVWNTSMVWCLPTRRNVQDVHIQCHADELMCTICCAMSHLLNTADIHERTVACSMLCNEINGRHPWKMQSKKHLHHVMRMRSCAWCDASGARAVFHSWHFASWFYLVINHGLTSVYIMSHAWDHAHQRMCSRTQDCATRKPTLLYYSCCFDFVCSMIRCDVW